MASESTCCKSAMNKVWPINPNNKPINIYDTTLPALYNKVEINLLLSFVRDTGNDQAMGPHMPTQCVLPKAPSVNAVMKVDIIVSSDFVRHNKAHALLSSLL